MTCQKIILNKFIWGFPQLSGFIKNLKTVYKIATEEITSNVIRQITEVR